MLYFITIISNKYDLQSIIPPLGGDEICPSSEKFGEILRLGHRKKLPIKTLEKFFVSNQGIVLQTLLTYGDPSLKEELINFRDGLGTNLVGKALNSNLTPVEKIQIAIQLVSLNEYKINSYLNNSREMDSLNFAHKIKHSNYTIEAAVYEALGGMTLFHKIIHIGANIKGSKEECKALISFFESLQKRNINSTTDNLFNPNYPTMNPCDFKYINEKDDEETTDYHMLSSSFLLNNIQFKSQKVKILCKKYFSALQTQYEAREYDDSSGDSEDGNSPAKEYQDHLIEFDKFIKEAIGVNLKNNKETGGNDTATLDQYSCDYSYSTPKMDIYDANKKFSQVKWDNFWNNLNDVNEQKQSVNIEDLVIPLFHGVPFMRPQYTNFERRAVVRKFMQINKKLLGKYTGSLTEDKYKLNPEEEILLQPHSRTSTASIKMESLYSMVTSNIDTLQKLQEMDEKLLKYFSKSDEHLEQILDAFKVTMKNYIFEFAGNKTSEFWTKVRDNYSFKNFPGSDLITYRYPIIATSKTPDHPAKFAIGNNVEQKTRGEVAMQPEYNNGKPTHRAAGLIYVTLHKLSDLIAGFKKYTAVDVNRALSLEEINSGQGEDRFRNQHECDFFGKITGETVAVIPIIYPHIRRADKINPLYHQAIWGLNPNPSNVRNITSVSKIIADLTNVTNPIVDNDSSFGKFMMPAIVNLVHGVVFSVAKYTEKFLVTISEDRKLISYNLKFDHDPNTTTKLSKIKRVLDAQVKAQKGIERNWEKLAKDSLKQQVEAASITSLTEKTARLEIKSESALAIREQDYELNSSDKKENAEKLYLACKNGDVSEVENLVKIMSKEEISHTLYKESIHRETALMIVAKLGYDKIAEILVKHMTLDSIKAYDEPCHDLTALDIAAFHGHYKVVKIIANELSLEDIDLHSPLNGYTPIQIAALENHFKAVEVLLLRYISLGHISLINQELNKVREVLECKDDLNHHNLIKLLEFFESISYLNKACFQTLNYNLPRDWLMTFITDYYIFNEILGQDQDNLLNTA